MTYIRKILGACAAIATVVCFSARSYVLGVVFLALTYILIGDE